MRTNSPQITSWPDFHRLVKSKGCYLLRQLNEFPASILITGCQRSGTTILAKIISESEGIASYPFGDDSELDGALILSGFVDHQPAPGRHCFQTTFLNECYTEYYDYFRDHKIVWVIRNPYSVVYSMLYNWGRPSFDSLFSSCGLSMARAKEQRRLQLFGSWGLSRLKKACYAYNGKTKQAFTLQRDLPEENITFIEYNQLITEKETAIPALYDFLSLDYKKEYADKIHNKSVEKSNKLSSRQKDIIKEICEPVYQQAVADLVNG